MRSKLFVSGSRLELLHKAAASKADAPSFDLDDAVVENCEHKTRAAFASFFGEDQAPDAKIIVVRLCAVGAGHFEAEMRAVVGAGLDLVNHPMVENPAAVLSTAALLDTFDAQAGKTTFAGMLINIENSPGLATRSRIDRRAAETVNVKIE